MSTFSDSDGRFSRFGPGAKPIPIDPSVLPDRSREAISLALRLIVKSVAFELSEDATAFRLLAPDTRYHDLDPDLTGVRARLGAGPPGQDVASFHMTADHFDLCFEDSWTGCFIARELAAMDRREDLILLHIDDHSDMMPTLLARSASGLLDPATGSRFDPSDASTWTGAIASGVVSIGNFITALLHAGHCVHIRHLRNRPGPDGTPLGLIADFVRYPLIPEHDFASVRLRSLPLPRRSFRAGDSPGRIMRDLPGGRLVVHIDLDYFINDFNGNAGSQPLCLSLAERSAICARIDRIFDALRDCARPVSRWIIATSPGFCAARHWHWLLDELDRRIGQSG